MIHSQIDSLSSFVGWNLFLCLACFLVQPALARWDENVAEGNKIEWTGFFFSPNHCSVKRRTPIKHSARGPKLSPKSLRNRNSVYARSHNL